MCFNLVVSPFFTILHSTYAWPTKADSSSIVPRTSKTVDDLCTRSPLNSEDSPLSPPRVYIIFLLPPNARRCPSAALVHVFRYGQCRHPKPQHDPFFDKAYAVKTCNFVTGSMYESSFDWHAAACSCSMSCMPRKFRRNIWPGATMSAVESVLDCACQGGECPHDEKSRTCFCSSINK